MTQSPLVGAPTTNSNTTKKGRYANISQIVGGALSLIIVIGWIVLTALHISVNSNLVILGVAVVSHTIGVNATTMGGNNNV